MTTTAPERSLAQIVAALPEAEREAILAEMDPDTLAYDPQFWLRPTQLRPIIETGWTLAEMVAGRGAGKTRSMCEWARHKAQGPPTRGALVARTAADVRDVLVAGESGILAVSPPSERPEYEPSKRLLTWPNGSTALMFSSEAPDQLRGPQFHWALADELACIPAGVLITTEHGDVPIEQVEIGEIVRTRSGWNRVLWSGPTRADAELWEIETVEGRVVRATPDHLVWTQHGWTRVDEMVPGDTLTTWPSSSSGTADAGTETEKTATTATVPGSSITARSGRPCTAPSPMGTSSTTATTTALTTRSRTSSVSRAVTTTDTISMTTPTVESAGARNSRVPRHVSAHCGSGPIRLSASSSAPGAGSRSARPVSVPSSATRTAAPSSDAVRSVQRLERREQTYDLTVENEHEFFANGVLVHNSWKYLPDESGLTAWDNLRLATRLGDHPQIFAGTTPKRTPFMRSLIKAAEDEPGVLLLRGSTKDNRGNLSQTYIDMIYGLYEGTALAQQELDGIMLDDIDGALWSEEIIEAARVKSIPHMRRPIVAVGVDPSVSEKPGDETGIVVAVTDGAVRDMYKRHAYVIADASLQAPPEIWAKVLATESQRFGRAPIIAETNQGGGLIKAVLTGIDPSLKVLGVHSRFGKAIRAEPVVLAAQQGRVHHVGYWPLLEDQLTTWVPDETRKSPDRLDAYVHVLTSLLVKSPEGLYGGTVRAFSPGRGRIPAAPRPRYRGPSTTIARRTGGGSVR